MAVRDYINETELRKAILQLHDNEVFEVRIIGSRNKSKLLSGYFKDADTLLKAFEHVDLRNVNVYITLQRINDSLFSRMQCETFIAGANSTNDTEVDGYQWLFIDLDPVRATGISSSDEELQLSFETARKVTEYLRGLGFEEPVKGMSGNGAHLLYRVSLLNTEENKDLIQNCLKTLAMYFDTDRVKVDTSNFNQSRVCKLYGTLAQKGANTQSRPHRMSKLYGDVRECKVTDKAYLQQLVKELPQEEARPTKENHYRADDFDVEQWLDKFGLAYKMMNYKDGVKYVLDECPFNPAHKAPDSMVTKTANGALGFKCLHNSCSMYKWRDLRQKFEPDAYEYTEADKRIEEGWKQHNREKELDAQAKPYIPEQKPDAPMFMNARMISAQPEPEWEFIRTGINVIDKKMRGFQKGCISVITGLRGAAKSTIISQIILNCVQDGHTSICYSGELHSKKFMNWLYIQAAGKGYTKEFERFDGYYCPDEYKPLIGEWLGDYMWLYNNSYGNNFSQIHDKLKAAIVEKKADICIVDNLMALDLTTFDTDKYDAQTKFVWKLKELAEHCNCHILFVAHPKKAQGFLRLDDVSGSGNITNIVDNAFIIHRNNADFKKKSHEMFGWKEGHEAYSGTNVIEICKDREGGTQDYFIPLWFEPETKRLRNFPTENVIYGWKHPDIWVDADPDEIPF